MSVSTPRLSVTKTEPPAFSTVMVKSPVHCHVATRGWMLGFCVTPTSTPEDEQADKSPAAQTDARQIFVMGLGRMHCCIIARTALGKPQGRSTERLDMDRLRRYGEAMFDVLLIVLPVFILIATGWIAVRAGYFKVEIAPFLNAYAIRLAVPVLLFNAMANLDLRTAFSVPLLASFYFGALSCFTIGMLVSRLVFKRRPGEAVAVGFAATFSNSVLLGLPIIQTGFEPVVLEKALGIIALHAPVIYTVGMVTMELMRRDGRPLPETLRTAGKSVIANPLMIGIVCGLLVNISGITLPQAVSRPVDMLAASAIPVALVGIGAALTQYRLSAALPETLTVAALSLVVHPAIVFVLAHFVLGLPVDAVRAAVTIAAMPPGVNIYIFASMYRRAEDLAASALLLSTGLAVVSVTGWLYAVRAITG